MATKILPKRTFGVGEIDESFYLRRDTDQYQDGAKRLRNARLLNSGSLTRRPGSQWIATLAETAKLVGFYFNDQQLYILAFTDEGMNAYLEDGTAAGSVSSAPWTTDMLFDLRFYSEGDTIFVCHQSMQTQKVMRTGADTWSLSDFEFSDGIGDTTAQPYFKFADRAVTLEPSGGGGAITLTASAPLFVADHVGTKFRYLEREIEISAINSATEAIGTVVQSLPAAQRLTVNTSGPFLVGQIAEHSTNNIKGIIFNIPDGTHVDIIPYQTMEAFASSGTLVGPDGRATVSGSASVDRPPLENWDEQVFSDVRGWPGVCALHRNRFVFMDHPLIPDAFITSKIGQYYDFDLGTGADSDAIFEFLGDGQVSRVRGLISAENLIILTDRTPYYVPERVGTPITPNSVSFLSFGFGGAGNGEGGLFSGGVVFPEKSGKRITRVRPTGDSETLWETVDISLLSPHLIKSPVDAAYAERFEDTPERYSFFVNNDGTMAVYHNIEDQQVNGFTLWETSGNYKSVAASGDKVFALTERTIGGDTVYCLERFDPDLRLDAVKEFDDPEDTIADYADTTVRVTGATYDFGDYDVGSDGSIDIVDTSFAGPFQAGFFFAPEVRLLPWEIVSDETIAGLMKRFTKIYLHVLNSGRYSVNGQSTTAYRGGDDLTAPPPLHTEIRQFSSLGRSREPEIYITQTDAVPLTILGITAEVSF